MWSTKLLLYELEKVITGVAIVISFVFLLLFVLCTLPYRLLVWVLAKSLRPDLGPMITDMCAVFSSERPEKAIFNLLYFVVIDGEISTERAREWFGERIFPCKNSRGEVMFKGMQTAWDYFMGYTFWRPDPNFDLEYYVRDYDYPGLELPNPCFESDLRRVVGGITKVHWEPGRSAWEAKMIHNYRKGDPKNPEERMTVLMFRHHHTTMDGYSIIELVRRLFQTDFPLAPPQFPKKSLGLKLLYPLILPFKVPYDAGQNLLESLDSHDEWHMNDETTRDYLTCWPKPIHVDRIKKIKNKYRVSYTAVLFAGICGGIYRILREAGRPIPDSLATLIPIPKPNHPGGAVNHVQVINTSWQIQAESPVHRLRKLQSNLDQIKNSTVPLSIELMIPTIGLLPTALRKYFVYYGILRAGTIIASSFPVTIAPTYVDGHRIVEMIPCTGTFGRKIGTAVLMSGLNSLQRVTINIDRKIFPSEEILSKLGDYIDEELEILQQEPL